jgi:hypothetical protein
VTTASCNENVLWLGSIYGRCALLGEVRLPRRHQSTLYVNKPWYSTPTDHLPRGAAGAHVRQSLKGLTTGTCSPLPFTSNCTSSISPHDKKIPLAKGCVCKLLQTPPRSVNSTRPYCCCTSPSHIFSELLSRTMIKHTVVMSSDKRHTSSDSLAATSDTYLAPADFIWKKFKTTPYYAIPVRLRSSSHLLSDATNHAVLKKLAALAARVPNISTLQTRLLKARDERYKGQFAFDTQPSLQEDDVCFAIKQLDREEAAAQRHRLVATPNRTNPAWASNSSMSRLYSIPADDLGATRSAGDHANVSRFQSTV